MERLGTGRLTEARIWDSYIDKSGEPVFPTAFILNPSALEVELVISLRGGGQAYLSEGTLAATINLLNAGSCQPEEEIILDVDITGHLPHIGKVNGTITAVCPAPQGP